MFCWSVDGGQFFIVFRKITWKWFKKQPVLLPKNPKIDIPSIDIKQYGSHHVQVVKQHIRLY